jgi:hypothetical protein
MYEPRTFLILSINVILMVFLMSLSPLEDQLRNVQIKNKLILRFFSHEDRLLSREIITMSP